MTPDFIYAAGPAHQDWMDLFLFHVALDEILPVAVTFEALLCGVLLVGYIRFRTDRGVRQLRRSRIRRAEFSMIATSGRL